LRAYSQQGVVTPDHTIRTKNWPLIVPAPDAHKFDEWKNDVAGRGGRFVARYHAYFAKHNARAQPKKDRARSPAARHPGAGSGPFRCRRQRQGRRHRRRHRGEHRRSHRRCGSHRPVSLHRRADMFDVEYWSLEQAKLGKAAEKCWRGRSAS